jgi:predicted RNA-binding Zn ribbon-like protein
MRPRPLSSPQMLDDLGWDDMGEPFEQPHEHVPSSIAALTPAPKGPAPLQVPVHSQVPVREEPAPVHVQQRVLAEHYAVSEPDESQNLSAAVVAALRAPAGKPGKKGAKAAAAGRKAAFTLRLDADRHLKLRLASALTRRSSQQLVTAALDAFLETLPEVGALALHVPARTDANS